MITLLILLTILGVLFLGITGVCAILLDPAIAILMIFGAYKGIKWVTGQKKK